MSAKLTKEILLDDIVNVYEEVGESLTTSRYQASGKYSRTPFRNRFGNMGNAIVESGVPHDLEKCPECGDYFNHLGEHWRANINHRPDITSRQHEILTGLLMGDGSATRTFKNGRFLCRMTNKNFLEWLDGEMGVMGTGVHHLMTSDEAAEKSRKNGFHPAAREENYSDQYWWNSRSHPDFNQYNNWYSSGEKRFPDDLELTSLTLKVWFCGDGNREKSEECRDRIRIGNTGQISQQKLLESLFKDLEVSPTFQKTGIRFGVDDSEKLYKYMEDPLPGFEYKWPDE